MFQCEGLRDRFGEAAVSSMLEIVDKYSSDSDSNSACASAKTCRMLLDPFIVEKDHVIQIKDRMSGLRGVY